MNTNINSDFPDLWFRVSQIGDGRIKVGRGCVFRFTGNAYPLTSLKTEDSDADISGGEENDPYHDLGTHFYIEEEEFDVEETGQVWLNIDLIGQPRNWQLSVVENDGVNHNNPEYVNSYALLKTIVHSIPGEDSLTYSFLNAPPEQNYNVLLADITVEEGRISINQIHDGVFILNRIIEYPS